MKNTLADLNNYLFEEIERLQDDSLSGDSLDDAIRRAEAVRKTADTIIDNANLVYRAYASAREYGESVPALPMFGEASDRDLSGRQPAELRSGEPAVHQQADPWNDQLAGLDIL